MELVFVFFILLFRFYILILKTAYNSLTKIDLHRLSEKEGFKQDYLKQRTGFQFILQLCGELTLFFLLFAVAYKWKIDILSLDNYMFWFYFFVYLFIEKLLVSLAAYINRDWVISDLSKYFTPFYYLFYPFVYLSVFISEKLIDFEETRVEDEEEKEEERAFIDVATEEGIIEEDEKELIKGVLDFGETIVREIMTPRMDLKAVELNSSYKDIMEEFKKAKHSRLPVFKESIDNIVGIINLKDMLEVDEATFSIDKVMKKPYFVPESKKVLELLRELQLERTKMAVVIDEYGGTDGVVTIEDLIEEIVGDIEDEHDVASIPIKKVDNFTFIVEGLCPIDDFEEFSGIELDFENVDTVGGAAFSAFGSVPNEGDTITFENLKITILKMAKRRIELVKIQLIEKNIKEKE